MSPAPERPPQRPSERAQVVRAVGRYTGYGLTWALAVLFFLLIGSWLDRRLGTFPWLTILGACIGAVGGFISLYRGVMAAGESERRDR